MADKNLILVKTIQKYPCLYNYHLPEYFKKEITERTWDEVSNETKMAVSDCKDKWKNLRYSFIRSLKLNRHGSSKTKYYLKDEMEFVLPYVRALPSILAEPPTYCIDSDTDEETTDNNQQTLSIQQIDESQLHISEPPKKKMQCDASAMYTDSSNLETPTIPQINDEEARRMFLLSLLPEVVTLSEPQMRSFRRKVLELIDDISNESPYLESHELELSLENTTETETLKSESTKIREDIPK